jgi:hypothetical protein
MRQQIGEIVGDVEETQQILAARRDAGPGVGGRADPLQA